MNRISQLLGSAGRMITRGVKGALELPKGKVSVSKASRRESKVTEEIENVGLGLRWRPGWEPPLRTPENRLYRANLQKMKGGRDAAEVMRKRAEKTKGVEPDSKMPKLFGAVVGAVAGLGAATFAKAEGVVTREEVFWLNDIKKALTAATDGKEGEEKIKAFNESLMENMADIAYHGDFNVIFHLEKEFFDDEGIFNTRQQGETEVALLQKAYREAKKEISNG